MAKISAVRTSSERKRVGRGKAAGRKEPCSEVVGKDDKSTVNFVQNLETMHES